MEQKLRTFNQCNSLIMWLNMHSKYCASFAYDGKQDVYLVEVNDDKGEVFSYSIEAVKLKSEKRLYFEFSTIAVVLVKLKAEVE